MERTIEDFVEDMLFAGRDLAGIRAVAQSTHWKNQLTEIVAYAENLLNLRKKKKRTPKKRQHR